MPPLAISLIDLENNQMTDISSTSIFAVCRCASRVWPSIFCPSITSLSFVPYLLLSSFITLQPFRFKCSCVDCALLLRSVESLLLLPFSSISSSFPFVFLITSFQLSDCLSECEYHPSFSRLYASESASASFHRSWQTSTECNMIWLSFYQWLGKNHFYINAECAEKAGSQFLEPT